MSVAAQTDVDLEIIVVDDKSTDDTLEVARTLAREDSRVRVIAHDINRGANATFNDGVAASVGDYVLLISADDLIAPGALGRATALMESDPNVAFVYGGVERFTTHPPQACASSVGVTWTKWGGDEWIGKITRRGRSAIYSPEALVRGDLAREYQYDPDLPNTADLLIWLRFAMRGSVGRVNGPPQAYYRKHGTNMHASLSWEEEARARVAAFDTFFRGDGGQLAGAERHHLSVRRGISLDAIGVAITLRDHLRGAPPRDDRIDKIIDFARELYPPVVETHVWARYEASARGSVGRVRRYVRAKVEGLRWDMHYARVDRKGV